MRFLCYAAAAFLILPGAHAGNQGERAVGAHVVSYHAPNRNYNNVNPGLYYIKPGYCGDGAVFGFYLNSFERLTTYAGCKWTIYSSERLSFDFFGGLTTGYRGDEVPLRLGKLAVFGVPSIRWDLAETVSLRIAAVPRLEKHGASLLHLSLERSF